jgi:polyisoprenoid-binding protein YceI
MVDLTKNKIFLILPLLLSLLVLISVKISFASDKFILNAERVKFNYFLGIIPMEGFFALKDSIFVLNFKKPNQSKLNLKFDLNSSSAGFDLATTAMLGETVLYAKKYPYIYFESKNVFSKDNQFNITGSLTIRGITKDVTFKAKLNNPSVLKNKVKNNLQFDIYAELKRSDFNATGYQYIVGDIINLKTRVELLLLDN